MIKILFVCHGRTLTNLNIFRKSSVIGAIKAKEPLENQAALVYNLLRSNRN